MRGGEAPGPDRPGHRVEGREVGHGLLINLGRDQEDVAEQERPTDEHDHLPSAEPLSSHCGSLRFPDYGGGLFARPFRRGARRGGAGPLSYRSGSALPKSGPAAEEAPSRHPQLDHPLLVGQLDPHLDKASIWPAPRRANRDDLERATELVPRVDRAKPGHVVHPWGAEAGGAMQQAIDVESHPDRGRVPTAGDETLEHRLLGQRGIDVVRLRVELPGELDDLLGSDEVRPYLADLADLKVLPEEVDLRPPGRELGGLLLGLHAHLLVPRGRSSRSCYASRPRSPSKREVEPSLEIAPRPDVGIRT